MGWLIVWLFTAICIPGVFCVGFYGKLIGQYVLCALMLLGCGNVA